MTRHIGIDPGRTGGIAALDGKAARAFSMPETIAEQCNLLRSIHEPGARVVLENVWIRSGQRGQSRFVTHFGALQGLLAAIGYRYQLVAPVTWQKAMGCQTGGDKGVTRAKARDLWPDLKITHKIADALLIAAYARDHAQWTSS